MFKIAELFLLVIYVLVIVDIARSALPSDKKLLWILTIIFLPVVGVLLYFLLGRKE